MFTRRVVYGVAEIAEEMGVSRQVVAQWKRRGKLPKPDEELLMGPVWKAGTLRKFFKEDR